MHRKCFAEFMKVVSLILKMKQTKESQKLVNEVFISDDAWQESVKNFTISVFLAEVATPVKLRAQAGEQRLEEVRGMNLVTFEEKSFFLAVLELGDLQAYQLAKESVQSMLILASCSVRYYQSVQHFFQEIQAAYFDSLGPKKAKQTAEEGAALDEAAKSRHIAKSQHNTRAASSLAQDLKQDAQEAEEDYRLQRKYWRHVCRNVCYNMAYLIQPPNGLLSSYLQVNATTYSSHAQNDLYSQDLDSLLPLNFSLTNHVLLLLKGVFQKTDTLTKYLLLEETMLFFIRTCYLSFIRLYNKISLKQSYLPT